MIHFDFDDRHEEELVVGSAISKRGGVVLSTGFHALILALLLFGPKWTFLEFLKPDPAELAARQEELLRQLREQQQNRRFVYIPPEVPDIEALEPPPNGITAASASAAQSSTATTRGSTGWTIMLPGR